MKRIVLSTVGVAVIAVIAAALGSAQPTTATAPTRAEATPALPKLPADIANRKRFIVGVKCDTPPFGYLDVRGKNAGVESRSPGGSPATRSGASSGSRSCAHRRRFASRC